MLDRVKFATATTGTSDIVVGAAERSTAIGDYHTPAEAGAQNDDVVDYVIQDGANWATGTGAYSTVGPTITRDPAERSWNGTSMATAKLSLSGFAKVMFAFATRATPRRPLAAPPITSASTITPAIRNFDIFRITAQAVNLTVNTPAGTPFEGQRIRFEISGDGVDHTITWAAEFGLGPATKPTGTGTSTVYCRTVEFVWHAVRAKWVPVLAQDEAASYATISLVGLGKSSTVSAGNNVTVSLTSLTGGSATTPIEGDTVFVFASMESTTDLTLAMSSAGYEMLADVYSNDTADSNLALFRKVMGVVPDATAVLAGVSGRSAAIAVTVLRGVDPVGIDVAVQTASGLNSGLANPPGATPITAGSLFLVGAGCAHSSGDSTDFASSDLSSFQTTRPDTALVAVASGIKTGGVAGTPFDPAALTGPTGNTNSSWTAVTAVIRPKKLN